MITIKGQIIKSLSKATGINNPNLEFSSRPEFGDYTSNAALGSKNPREEALKITELLQKDKSLNDIVEKIDIAGSGFINFHLSTKALTTNLSRVLDQKENYGKSEAKKGQTWLIEHTSPNPNKAMHLGHLRNNVLGMSISNLWENVGVKVIRDDIDNNRGIAIAKLMWGYLRFANKNNDSDLDINYWFEHQDEWNTPKDLGIRPDRFVDDLYSKASVDFKNEEVEKKVRQMVIDWEANDEKTWALWKLILSYSYEGQEMTLKRLGNIHDKVWHESDHYKEGKEIVDEGLKKGIFKKGEGGAIVTDLKKYKLPDTVVIKSDGTALYITQDLALTKLKKKTFHPNHLYWVIGPEQSLALKQLFAVCEQLGIGNLDEFTHIAFGYMSIKGKGKMSSRTGNVVYIDDLLDDSIAEVKEKIKGEFTNEEKQKISEEVGIGAVKYSILKVGRLQDIAFDINESISFEGNSGPYLQYTYARTESVLNKSNKKPVILSKVEGSFVEEELLILRTLSQFEQVVEDSAIKYSPNILCEYLYRLASSYNTFYNKVKIIGSEKEEFGLALTMATGQVLKNGLTLLGIASPEKM
jgi:arginyl-tRNA synthetase